MSQLIDDILQLSRVTRAEMNRAEVNLSVVAETVVGQLQKIEPERRVETVIIPEIIVNGDASLLRIVFDNLLGNSWKFTSKREAAKIEFGMSEVGGKPTYYVRDNGAGFDMAYANKLFGPFQRLHAAEDFPGTGIGLATVQRIIRRHGGRVWAEGEVEKGATFYFTLS